MDKEITRLMKTGVSVDETKAYELLSAKRDLGQWLSQASPEWAQANRFFAKQSKPVRQMEVGQEMKKRLGQSEEAFLEATGGVKAQEAMIRGATGRPNTNLTDVFNLGQMSKIAGLRNEAQITQEVGKLRNMARASLGEEKAFQLPNLLNVWVAVANRVARTSADMNVRQVTEAAAEILNDPQALRKLLIEDAARRSASMKPLSREMLGRIAPPSMVSGGMLTGEPQ
jgi:hypothetical protein